MRPVAWVGSSREDLREFPRTVRQRVGTALQTAQDGGKHPDAKPLRGHRGTGVVEIVENFDGQTYRAVYTVRFAEAVYVLHCFQKKSARGIATAQRDLDLIEARLIRATEFHQQWLQEQKGKYDQPHEQRQNPGHHWQR